MKILYKIIRKIAHHTFPVALKTAKLIEKVELKTTRIITKNQATEVFKGRNKITVDALLSQHLPQSSLIYPALPIKGRGAAVTGVSCCR